MCVEGSLQTKELWGCGRHFARVDGLLVHFRSETGAACLSPLLDFATFLKMLRAAADGQITCKQVSANGKQLGCGQAFNGEGELKAHFEASGGKGCIRQIVIRFARIILSVAKNSHISMIQCASGSFQDGTNGLARPSVIAWHPSDATASQAEAEIDTSMTDFDFNLPEISYFDLQLSHDDGGTAGDVWNYSGMSANGDSIIKEATQWQSTLGEVESLLTRRFNASNNVGQWIVTTYRAGTKEGITALIDIVISQHLLQGNQMWLTFGEAKCAATWIVCLQPKNLIPKKNSDSDWYEYRISATVPPFSATNSSSPVKLGIVIDHDEGGHDELAIGEMEYYGKST